MKKILTIVAVASLSAAAFGQGVINWNSAAGFVIGNVNGTVYSPFEAAGSPSALTQVNAATPANTTSVYYYELLVGANGITTDPSTLSAFGSTWTDSGITAENGAAANGKILQSGVANAPVAGTASAGGNYSFLLVGWSANLGTTWSAVLGNLNSWSTDASTIVGPAYFGVSAVGSSVAVLSSTTSPGNYVIGNGAGEIYNPSSAPMQLDQVGLPVPEPGTLALAALGGASMLMLRRKK